MERIEVVGPRRTVYRPTSNEVKSAGQRHEIGLTF